jgi:two-component system LytT family sensor kinase
MAIPSLVLQPLIENAVRHAVASRPEGGRIVLAARPDGDRLVIEVSDDGPGFDDAPPSGAGFGLHSVRERLRVAGPGHDVAVDSTPGRGATVRLTLPLRPHTDPPPTGDPS